ncbi:MAG: ATP-dependent helicase [Roseateles sp.]|nr:MAG: ATP-dependent helicase [Roseateles sp.]
MVANTYGSVKLEGSVWHIQAEPFVNSRLKRVFPRIPKDGTKGIKLSTSPENTRELSWFIQRYPMVMSGTDRLHMDRLATQHVAVEQRLAELIAGLVPPPVIEMAHPPRDYQSFGAQLTLTAGSLLLADELGLGKTITAIAAIVLSGAFPAVVVAPAHLTRQWEKQIRHFAPNLTVYRTRSGSPYEKDKPGVLVNMTGKRRTKKNQEQMALLPESTLPDVIVTTYDMLKGGWAEFLAQVAKFAVYDECQALAHSTSGRYKAAETLAGGVSFRMGLSATPITGYGCQFYNVLNVLRPDALGSYGEFLTEWCTQESITDPTLFGEYLRREGYMLRRTRKEVGRELPPLTKVIHEVESDTKKLEELAGNAAALARIVLSHNEQFKGQKMQASAEFDMLMRQATGIAKAPYVVEFVKLLLDSGEKVVLWGWHRAVYDIWLEGLKEYKPRLYTGTESGNQKDEAMAAFIQGDCQLLIMSLRSGAGADGLQAVCRIGVVGELDWSPSVIAQCFGRLDRDGQTSPVTGYVLVSDDGADPIMMDVLGIKREQLDGVVLNADEKTLIERVDLGENTLQKLARDFLLRRGEKLPEPSGSSANGTTAGVDHATSLELDTIS